MAIELICICLPYILKNVKRLSILNRLKDLTFLCVCVFVCLCVSVLVYKLIYIFLIANILSESHPMDQEFLFVTFIIIIMKV